MQRGALAQRLAEAEATIDALLSGQIDAVVDVPSQTPVLLARAQDALRLSEERYRRIVETANEGVWQVDAAGKTTFMNLRMAQMLGCESDMGLGRTPFEFLGEDQRARMREHQRVPTARQIDIRFTRLDGSSTWAILEATPIFDSAGRYTGSLAMVMDVTGRREAEVALRKTEEQYREIVEATTDGIVKVDAQGRIVFVNGRFAEMLGYAPQEMLGMSAFDLIPPEARSVAERSFQRRRHGGADAADTTVRHRNGTHIAVHVAGSPLVGSKGEYVGSLGVVRDMRERLKLQAQLMVSDRMASVGTLAAGVAHEINNPLTAVVMNLEYIGESLRRMSGGAAATPRSDAWLREEIQGPLDDAREAAQRVRIIVRDLKVFSRSPVDEPVESVDVKAIMESSLRMAWNEIRHRARLVKDYGEVPLVAASEARLGQVFLNLVVNAAQAVPVGTADDNEIRVRTRLEDERVLVEVSDTGVGIPPEAIGRIFDAFYTTKAVGVGTGLGLAICQRIVTGMGGELAVRSEPGVGTTFTVSLPIAREDPVGAPAPAAEPAVVGRRGHILLVDDEPSVLRILERLLAKDHEVVAVESAREALGLCVGGTTFDLILCDMMMPDMTGMDLHSELAKVLPKQAERMIFLTGGAFTTSARDFLSASDRKQIEKPFDSGNLRAIIQQHLRQLQ